MGSQARRDKRAQERGVDMDLSRLKMGAEQALAAGEKIELANGMRCGGCGRRIKRGFHFTSIAPREQQPVIRLCACSRIDCSFAAACREGATVVEQVEFVWLDEAGDEAAPAGLVVKQNEKLQQRQQADAEVQALGERARERAEASSRSSA